VGADILKKRQATYKKHIDRNRYELAQRDLFTIDPSKVTRNILCDAIDRMPVTETALTIQAIEGALVTFQGRERIGECKNPPKPTYDSIRNGGGAVSAEIKSINPISNTFEASICE